MTALEKYYGKFDEEPRLLTRHGQVEFITSMKYIHDSISSLNKEKSEAAGLSFKKETTYTIEELGLGEGQGSFDSSTMTPLAKLRSGESKRLVVTIYLEGWDLDVVESIGNGSFNLNLGFKGLAQPFED